MILQLPETGFSPTNLKYVVRNSGLTRSEAAEALGVSKSGFDKWCDGKHDMPLSKWRELEEIVAKTKGIRFSA